MMYYVRVKDDPAKRRWKVREAVSLKAAYNAITHARVTGSVGASDYVSRPIYKGFKIVGFDETCMADVVQVNSDNTEREPYSAAY